MKSLIGKIAVGRRLWLFALVGILIWGVVGAVARTTNVPSPRAQRFQPVVINNLEPRRDMAGEIVDAHDGCLQFFAGRYYLYGTTYGHTAGFSINNRFRVYSSADLQQWRLEGELLASPPDGVYYRPYVVFNPHTRKYVLWYNWYPKLWDGQNGVATSDSPVGPFQIVNPDVQLSQSKDHPGDGSLFVDGDGTGYFIYTTIGQGHAIRVEQLTPDYLGSVGKISAALGNNCEAPVLFRRGQIYYALFDSCCCFCPAGSGARVLTATSPLGPYTQRQNIIRLAGGKEPTIAAQQTWVAQIPTDTETAFVWMGDRWGSRPDGIKGHDFQFWSAPLQFSEDGHILPIEDVPTWRASVRLGENLPTNSAIYVWPKKKDPYPVTKDPCSGKLIPPEQIDG